MKISQIISSILLSVYGIWMIIVALIKKEAMIFLFVLGLGSIGLGVYILLNNKEDKIEQIKKQKGGKKWQK